MSYPSGTAVPVPSVVAYAFSSSPAPSAPQPSVAARLRASATPYRPTHGRRDNTPAFLPPRRSIMSELHDISTFHHFPSLSDDLMLIILTYVADVPFEGEGMSHRSTMTHVLPYVSKQVQSLCASTDRIWTAALRRRLQKEPNLWGEGLRSLIEDLEPRVGRGAGTREDEGGGREIGTEIGGGNGTLEEGGSGSAFATCSNSAKRARRAPIDIVAAACDVVQRHPASDTYPPGVGPAQKVFRYIVSRHIRFTGPVFYMPGTVRLGQEFGLHFFEPRYRLLISELMAPYPVRYRRGDPITLDGRHRRFPSFVYGNHSPLAPTTPACIVEVRQCLIHPNGTADVFLVPSAYVWLERVWERRGTGGLAYARCVRMGRGAGRSLEESVLAAQIARRRAFQDYEGAGGGAGVPDADGMETDAPPGLHINALLQYLAARMDGEHEVVEIQDSSEEEG